MEELFAVSMGIIAGIITGVVPGAGVTVAMVIATPLLFDFTVLQLLLFYMALASMVQFTGTIPAVLLGVPGETNSLPAVIEGTKFTRCVSIGKCIGEHCFSVSHLCIDIVVDISCVNVFWKQHKILSLYFCHYILYNGV